MNLEERPLQSVSGINKKVESLVHDFQQMLIENKRLKADNELLKSQLLIERGKVNELRSHFDQIESFSRQKSQFLSSAFERVLNMNHNMASAPSNLQFQSTMAQILQEEDSDTSNSLSQIPEGVVKILNTQYQQIQAVFAEVSDFRTNITNSLIEIIYAQTEKFNQEFARIFQTVQQIILILKKTDSVKQMNGRYVNVLERQEFIFREEPDMLSATFHKSFAEKLLQENKYLMFCLEKMRKRLKQTEGEDQLHVWEIGFLEKNKRNMIQTDEPLYASIEELFDRNKQLEHALKEANNLKAQTVSKRNYDMTKVDDVLEALSASWNQQPPFSNFAPEIVGKIQQTLNQWTEEQSKKLYEAFAVRTKVVKLKSQIALKLATIDEQEKTIKKLQEKINSLETEKQDIIAQLTQANLTRQERNENVDSETSQLLNDIKSFLKKVTEAVPQADMSDSFAKLDAALQKITSIRDNIQKIASEPLPMLIDPVIEANGNNLFEQAPRPLQLTDHLIYLRHSIPQNEILKEATSVALEKHVKSTPGRSQKLNALKRKIELQIDKGITEFSELTIRVAKLRNDFQKLRDVKVANGKSENSVNATLTENEEALKTKLALTQMTRNHLIHYLQKSG